MKKTLTQFKLFYEALPGDRGLPLPPKTAFKKPLIQLSGVTLPKKLTETWASSFKKKFYTVLLATLLVVSLSPKASASEIAFEPKLDALAIAPFAEAFIKTIPEPKEQPKKIEYTVRKGDSLSKIAQKFDTSWERLWYKNKKIKHPNMILKGSVLTIPRPEERLKARTVPTAPQRIKPLKNAVNRSQEQMTVSRRAPSGSGWYYAGQCTAWVASQRYVPDGWGDASNWLYAARAAGYKTGSTPKAGAIGWKYGHVVYVISVQGSNVLISEQNYRYIPFEVRTILKPASTYTYIY